MVTALVSDALNDTLVEEPDRRADVPGDAACAAAEGHGRLSRSVTPLAIGQERSIKLVEDVVSGDRVLALVTVKNPEAEQPGWDDLYEVGTAAVIHKMIKVPDGTLRILVQGVQRIKLDAAVAGRPVPRGRVRRAAGRARRDARGRGSDAERPEPVRACHRPRPLPAGRAADRRGERRRPERALQPRRLHAAPQDGGEAAAAGAHRHRGAAAGHLGHPQPRARGLRARSKIQSQVQEEMEKGQREFFLRQQLKAIQDELGESDPEAAEIAELRSTFDSMELPEDVRKVVDRELAGWRSCPPPRPSTASSVRTSTGSPRCRGTRRQRTTSTSTTRSRCWTRTTSTSRR